MLTLLQQSCQSCKAKVLGIYLTDNGEEILMCELAYPGRCRGIEQATQAVAAIALWW